MTGHTNSIATVVFCNAGQGDNIGIRLTGGQIVVVDSNIRSDAIVQRPPVLSYLAQWCEERGSYDLDLLCITHPDHDHFHGMTQIIEWVEAKGGTVRRILQWPFGSPKDFALKVSRARERATGQSVTALSRLRRRTTEFVRLVDEIARLVESGTELIWGVGNQAVLIDDDTRLFTIGPPASVVSAHVVHAIDNMLDAMLVDEHHVDRSANELSTILVLEGQGTRALLTGDATQGSLGACIESVCMLTDGEFRLRAQLIKLPHHGSRESSSRTLWKTLLDECPFVVVSAGNHAGYRHPDETTIADLRAVCPGSQLFCTNVCPMHSDSAGWLRGVPAAVGSSRVDLQACKLEYSIVSPK